MEILDQNAVNLNALDPYRLNSYSQQLGGRIPLGERPTIIWVNRTPEGINIITNQSPVFFENPNNEPMESRDFGNDYVGLVQFLLDPEDATSLKLYVGNTVIGIDLNTI